VRSCVGFCSSELHERIEKRESMIKMGMENVADSLIPGFDKLEEKFIELVQMMKSLVCSHIVSAPLPYGRFAHRIARGPPGG
jgi:hypothetical protein